jgi:hypothetical protein
MCLHVDIQCGEEDRLSRCGLKDWGSMTALSAKVIDLTEEGALG